MKSGDTYRFSLLWSADSEEHVLAGEFLEKLGNKKSRFIVQLICDYLNKHPEALTAKETIHLIFNSPAGSHLAEMIRSIIQAEFAGKTLEQNNDDGVLPDEFHLSDDSSISTMFDNLDIWNSH